MENASTPTILTTLSADAVPVLVEALPEIGDRLWNGYTVEQAVVDRWDSGQADWRTWNLGRSDGPTGQEPCRRPERTSIRMIKSTPTTKIGRLCTVPTELSTTCVDKRPQRGISGSSVTSS